MKNKIKKGFLAFALIFTLIGITTLKNDKIGAYAPAQQIEEFNTPNLLSNFEILSYQDVIGGPYINVLGKKIDRVNDKFSGFNISFIYTYILDLKGLQNYIDNIELVPIVEGHLIADLSLTLEIDKLSNQQLVNIYDLDHNYFEAQNENMEIILVFETPSQLGQITSDMIIESDIGLYNYQAELLYKPGGISDNGLNGIFDLINKPINDLLDYIGIEHSLTFTPGIGQVTWFEISLRKFIKLIIVFLIGLWFIKFLVRLIRKFFGVIMGVFNI